LSFLRALWHWPLPPVAAAERAATPSAALLPTPQRPTAHPPLPVSPLPAQGVKDEEEIRFGDYGVVGHWSFCFECTE